MEIIVKGEGRMFVAPDQTILHFEFSLEEKKYTKALENGSLVVSTFTKEIARKHGFETKDFRTNSLRVRREAKYDSIKKKNSCVGYSYKQNLELKFDYDMERTAKIIEDVSGVLNPPDYSVEFTVKDEEVHKQECIFMAFRNAEISAQSIAKAAGKTLKCCEKIDFNPFSNTFVASGYEIGLGSGDAYNLQGNISIARAINDTFTPKDIEIAETLYCLWIAE